MGRPKCIEVAHGKTTLTSWDAFPTIEMLTFFRSAINALITNDFAFFSF